MDKQHLETSLADFLKARENKNIEAVVGLLADKFEYFETPFLKHQTIAITQEFGYFRLLALIQKQMLKRRVKALT